MKNIHVIKFGGTSVSTLERWETIRAIVQSKLDQNIRPFIVCSALSGISNTLEKLMVEAPKKDGDWRSLFLEVKRKYESFAKELDVDSSILAPELNELERLALGASLTGELSPRLWAKGLSTGELLLTRLGASYFEKIGIDVHWVDARDYLFSTTEVTPFPNDKRHFLSADCDFSIDDQLKEEAKKSSVIITQGFIASDEDGETVLLGRGGSDTSAAYFSAKLEAKTLEIWTDVPGMFTANPRDIPSARLLKELHYDEAQEIATTGAKVLHPRCIEPLRRSKIPLKIRSTQDPALLGTTISDDLPDFGPQVKAISSKDGIVLISMSTVGMWQQVGFLADIFGVFKKHGISIDLVATSETNVTVTLDPGANPLEEKLLEKLVDDLNLYCISEVIGPCTAVSLVGQKIRAILHRLGSTLEAFEEQEIFLLSQAASDLNLTFVVSEENAKRLVRGLHTLLFEEGLNPRLFGHSWKTLFDGESVQSLDKVPWWQEKREELLNLKTPSYVYDLDTIEKQAASLLKIESLDRLYYAMKANDNIGVLRTLYAKGIHFECVSPFEVDYIFDLFPEIEAKRVLFTPNFASKEEYEKVLKKGTYVTVDSVYALEHWAAIFSGKEILLRVDPGEGDGHHRFVKTAGKASKFGISIDEIESVKAICDEHDIHILGIHAHIGSGILKTGWWAKTGAVLAEVAKTFPSVRILNLGGGLGVPEKAWQRELDIEALGEELRELKQVYKNYDLWMEPGRYFVAEAGVILAKVTQVKSKGSSHYLGIETGMNSLIRPALYGAYHRIVNLSKFGEAIEDIVDIVGPICESGDVLGHKRGITKSEEGDVMLIATAGAYGHTMASHYNRRKPADEICIGTNLKGEIV